MYTIENKITNELIIKNSKFICKIYRLNNIDEVNNILNNIHSNYKDATHYCYAYIYDNQKKYSDDKEPSKTAGAPILEVLEKNNLNYVLAVVIRYFGGIKLGTGGLVRAYTKSVVECLEQTNKKELIEGYDITIEFSYSIQKRLDYLLKDIEFINKSYNDKIIYRIKIDKNLLDILTTIQDINIIINNKIYL